MYVTEKKPFVKKKKKIKGVCGAMRETKKKNLKISWKSDVDAYLQIADAKQIPFRHHKREELESKLNVKKQ